MILIKCQEHDDENNIFFSLMHKKCVTRYKLIYLNFSCFFEKGSKMYQKQIFDIKNYSRGIDERKTPHNNILQQIIKKN